MNFLKQKRMELFQFIQNNKLSGIATFNKNSIIFKGDGKLIVHRDKKRSESFKLLFDEIREYIEKTGIEDDGTRSQWVEYYAYDFSNFNEKGYVVDISAAYPTTAFKMGFISRGILNKMMQLQKIDRLQILGALAANPRKMVFKDGVKIVEFREEMNPIGACVFFKVSQFVGAVMREKFAEYGAFMYWVDGMFFGDKKNAKKFEKFLKQMKYRTTVKEIQCTYNEGIFTYTDNKGEEKKYTINKNSKL